MLDPSRRKHSLVSKLQFISQFIQAVFVLCKSFFQYLLRHFTFLMLQILFVLLFEEVPLTFSMNQIVIIVITIQRTLATRFFTQTSKNMERGKAESYVYSNSWGLRIQPDFLFCLLAAAATKTIMSWYILYQESQLKILCIFVFLCLDKMILKASLT